MFQPLRVDMYHCTKEKPYPFCQPVVSTRGQQQGKIDSKILEILKILRVVCDKNREITKNYGNLLEFTVILMILPKISGVALKIFSLLLTPWVSSAELVFS